MTAMHTTTGVTTRSKMCMPIQQVNSTCLQGRLEGGQSMHGINVS